MAKKSAKPDYSNPSIIRHYNGYDDEAPLLSVLIPTLYDRAEQFTRLLDALFDQQTEEVEILINDDDGTQTTGRKRNELLTEAKGAFVAFVDDDDAVSHDYVKRLTEAIRQDEDADVIGIVGEYSVNGQPPRRFVHALRYPTPKETRSESQRPPHHLNPVARSVALKAMFPDETVNEDVEYGKRILPLLKRETMADGPPVYFYQLNTGKQQSPTARQWVNQLPPDHPALKRQRQTQGRQYHWNGWIE